MTPAPTETNIATALRTFLLTVLPAGVDVIALQPNRVPEPDGDSWVGMTTTRTRRLRTNVSTYADVRFTGSTAGAVLTVSSVDFGTILPGAQLFGLGVAQSGAGVHILAQTGGTPGGPGTYGLDASLTVGAEVLSSGARNVEEGVEVAVQLDFHAPGGSGASFDMAHAVSALFRDRYATEQFASQIPNYGVTPLHADDPRQTPFLNDQAQIETVWTVDAFVQANLVLSIPQQFADALAVEVVSVEAAYPP